MGKSLGKNAILQLAGTDVSTWLTQTDFQRVVDLLDSHTFGDSAKEVVPGLTDATIGLTGLYDDLATLIDQTLNTMFTDADGFTVNLYPVGTASGKAYYTGQAFARNERIGIPVAGLETFGFDIQFSGGVSRTTVA